MIKKYRLILFICLSASISEYATAVNVIPVPKEINDTGQILIIPDNSIIVMPENATEPEQYAAERLQTFIARRFKIDLPISTENNLPNDTRFRILLGRPETHELLKRFCEIHSLHIQPDGEASRNDACAVSILDDEKTAVIAGSNERSVIYGANLLFKLIQKNENGELTLPVVTIHDWPSIPWRGGAGGDGQFTADILDALMWNGENYTLVNYVPNKVYDHEETVKNIRAAHKRGMYVWGRVACAVKPPEFDGVLAKFQELIDCGVDGLWISFDDAGAGEGTQELVKRILDLGRNHHMSERDIAITPPGSSYQHVMTDFNKSYMKIPGMEKATWFFTRIPSRGIQAETQDIGLQRLPAFWHNWPRPSGGILYSYYKGTSFRAHEAPAYYPVKSLSDGWWKPEYSELVHADKYADTVRYLNLWPPEYTGATFCIWAWNPAKHNFMDTRRAIYDMVFGPSAVEYAIRFDDALNVLESYYCYQESLPRLKPLADIDSAASLVHIMQESLRAIRVTATEESLIQPERLESVFLEPMQATINTARAVLDITFPDQCWPPREGEILSLYSQGRALAARRLARKSMSELKRQIQEIENNLADLNKTKQYCEYWQQRVDACQNADEDTYRKLYAEYVETYFFTQIPRKLRTFNKAPESGRLVYELSSDEVDKAVITRDGAWSGAVYDCTSTPFILMSHPHWNITERGGHCRVDYRLPVPQFNGRLILRFYIAGGYGGDASSGYDPFAACRYYQFFCGEQMIWEEPATTPHRKGYAWYDVDITDFARDNEELVLSFQVIDYRAIEDYSQMILLGPLRFVEMP